MWCRVPNFVILSLAQFTENADIRGYALNRHWYSIFARCIPLFPHLLVRRFALSFGAKTERSTEFQVARVEVNISEIAGQDHSQLLKFHSLRHLQITYVCAFSGAGESFVRLSEVIRKLPDLQTISLLTATNAWKINNRQLLDNLPLKLTSLNLGWVDDLADMEKHFAQLLHYNPPWNRESDIYLYKMPNLHTLVVAGNPESFDFLTNMLQLHSLTWFVKDLPVEQWNHFVRASISALRNLRIDSIDGDFKHILASKHALPLLSVENLFLHVQSVELPLESIKIFPRLKHLSLCAEAVDINLHSNWLEFYIPQYAMLARLDSVSVYFLDVFTRIGYCRGDSRVSWRRYNEHSFGL